MRWSLKANINRQIKHQPTDKITLRRSAPTHSSAKTSENETSITSRYVTDIRWRLVLISSQHRIILHQLSAGLALVDKCRPGISTGEARSRMFDGLGGTQYSSDTQCGCLDGSWCYRQWWAGVVIWWRFVEDRTHQVDKGHRPRRSEMASVSRQYNVWSKMSWRILVLYLSHA